MKKEEFMQAAALRLISAWPEQSMEAIADKAKELTERIYAKKPHDDYFKWWDDDVDVESIDKIIMQVKKTDWPTGGYAKRLMNAFKQLNLTTVGDLLHIGRYDFQKCRDVGNGSICRLDDALKDLFGIDNW